MGGNLTDEQLREFDAYLNGAQPALDNNTDGNPVSSPTKTEPKVASDNRDIKKVNDDYLNKIIELHDRKATDIMKLLDKIDAKGHKDIVADLVDEMQYQKGVVRRETEQIGKLRQLFAQAAEASK